MQIKIFIIPIIDCVDEEENLNKFLSSHKIVNRPITASLSTCGKRNE